jgi:glutamine amidotransferase
MKITIIDYGMGNLGSIANMINKVGGSSLITSNLNEIAIAQKLILPGVGAFDTGMKNLSDSGLIALLNEKVLFQKIPILGICLGMQLMTQQSEEGKLKGLGWLDALTVKFNFNSIRQNLHIPHMGWNTLKSVKESNLIQNQKAENRFYFVHSYYVKCNRAEDVLTTTEYGFEFCSAFEKDNIMGVQFHPEKSHKFGMQLFNQFIKCY